MSGFRLDTIWSVDANDLDALINAHVPEAGGDYESGAMQEWARGCIHRVYVSEGTEEELLREIEDDVMYRINEVVGLLALRGHLPAGATTLYVEVD